MGYPQQVAKVVMFRDLEWEAKILEMTQNMGIGAQFGGKYYCHDVRVIRLPRHGASCPIGLGVSCSADRQAFAKINKDGVFLERLETDPGKYIPDTLETDVSDEVVNVDLNKPMDQIRKQLSQYPIKTRVALSGPMIVARDIAHAKLKERLDSGHSLPDYLKNHPIYYAGPAKTPEGLASGSFGPTTAGEWIHTSTLSWQLELALSPWLKVIDRQWCEQPVKTRRVLSRFNRRGRGYPSLK